VAGQDHRIPFFGDLSLAHKAIVDGGMSKAIEPTPCPANGPTQRTNESEKAYLKPGLKFPNLVEYKSWLCDYTVKNHRPFVVKHSDCKKRYTVKCEKERCTWIVRARKIESG
jgi:hypothetical protein